MGVRNRVRRRQARRPARQPRQATSPPWPPPPPPPPRPRAAPHLAKGLGVVVELAQRAQRVVLLVKLHKPDALGARRAVRARPRVVQQDLGLPHARLGLLGALLDLGGRGGRWRGAGAQQQRVGRQQGRAASRRTPPCSSSRTPQLPAAAARTACRKSALSCFSVQEGGMLRTLSRVVETTKLGLRSLSFFSSGDSVAGWGWGVCVPGGEVGTH